MVLAQQNSIKNDLNNSFVSCQHYLRTLSDVTFKRNDILPWFQVSDTIFTKVIKTCNIVFSKGLCRHLTTLIKSIGSYCKENKEKSTISIQNTLLLYLTQALTSLSLLINIFVREEEIQIVINVSCLFFVVSSDY